MDIGKRMKSRRKQLGYSAEKVASEMGLSPATIYRYEKGDIKKMPGNLLEPLAELLNTTPAYLMGWDDDPENYETAEEINNLPLELLKFYNGNTEDAVKAYRAIERDRYEEANKKPIPEDELDNELISLLSDLTPEEIVRVADFVSGLKAARAATASRNK